MKRAIPFVPLVFLLGYAALGPGETPPPRPEAPRPPVWPALSVKGLAEEVEAAREKEAPAKTTPKATFAGLWKTTFGRMRLRHEGEVVRGTYAYQGEATVEGKVAGRRFTFTYEEPAARGEGYFELSPDGRKFVGRWRPAGGRRWQPWVGERIEPVAGRVWLVVLEAYWETALADQEYAFGHMLRAFFARSDKVAVRHRFFHDAETLARYCRELAYLAEPVVLVIATHAGAKGLSVAGKTVGPAPLAASLRGADNLRLLHFSACLTMRGGFGQEIVRQLGDRATFPISGYATSVDWAASAIIEFLYLDMILTRGMDPRAATGQVARLLPFAGDKPIPGAALPPAGFRLLIPRAAE